MHTKRDGHKHDPQGSADEVVTAVEARDLFGDLLSKARLMNARTVITKNGKPVAAIVPIRDYERLVA